MSIHAHKILEMMQENNYSEASLVEAIHAKFGHEARYHTCSAQDMDAQQIVAFLKNKGKFKEASSGFTVDKTAICDHEH